MKNNTYKEIADLYNAIKMPCDDFRLHIASLILYKEISENITKIANEILFDDRITYCEIIGHEKETEYLREIERESIKRVDCFLKPNELFSEIVQRSKRDKNNFILEDLNIILKNIEVNTMKPSDVSRLYPDDYTHLFKNLDINSSVLGETKEERNKTVVKMLLHLDGINFGHDRENNRIFRNMIYEDLIEQFTAGIGKEVGETSKLLEVYEAMKKTVTTRRNTYKERLYNI